MKDGEADVGIEVSETVLVVVFRRLGRLTGLNSRTDIVGRFHLDILRLGPTDHRVGDPSWTLDAQRVIGLAEHSHVETGNGKNLVNVIDSVIRLDYHRDDGVPIPLVEISVKAAVHVENSRI